jgi:hypothetical protein
MTMIYVYLTIKNVFICICHVSHIIRITQGTIYRPICLAYWHYCAQENQEARQQQNEGT